MSAFDAKTLLDRYGIKPHATRRRAHRFIVAGGLLGLVGGALGSIAAGVLGGLCAFLGLWVRRRGNAAQVINRALHEFTIGRDDNAETLLAYAERSYGNASTMARVIDLQYASIALKRGEVEEMLARAKTAMTRPLGWANRLYDQQQQIHATALYGFACASLDRREDAAVAIET
ncbi:MAG: hypothetical protein AAGA56_21495, partial [Myxococcota bacterium]